MRLFWQLELLRSRASTDEALLDILQSCLIIIDFVRVNATVNEFGPISMALLDHLLNECRILIRITDDLDNSIAPGYFVVLLED